VELLAIRLTRQKALGKSLVIAMPGNQGIAFVNRIAFPDRMGNPGCGRQLNLAVQMLYPARDCCINTAAAAWQNQRRSQAE
jgi:hypothetical protein